MMWISGVAKFAGPRYHSYMNVNAVGKEFAEVERAYIAGFLDADGAIMALIEKHSEKHFGYRVRIAVKITQRDRKILDWFCGKWRKGSVKKNRTAFDWITRDQKIAKVILTVLLPYLKVKKKQAEIALKILNSELRVRSDLIKVARLADALSKFNVRSKNRRKNFATMIQAGTSPND